MKNKQFKMKNGDVVNIPKETKEHLLAHPDVWMWLEDAISKIEPSEGETFLLREVDMKRIIGKSGAVRLKHRSSKEEKLLFAKRVGRKNWSRVVVGHPAPEVSTIVVIARKTGDHQWDLITAYIGWLAEREPTDPNLNERDIQKSIDFWSNYALIWDKDIFGPIREMTWEEAISLSRS